MLSPHQLGQFVVLLLLLSGFGNSYAQDSYSDEIQQLMDEARQQCLANPDSAVFMAKNIIQQGITGKNQRLEIDGMLILGMAHFKLRQGFKADSIFTKVLAQPHITAAQKYAACFSKAKVFSFMHEDFFNGTQWFLEAKKIAETNGLDQKLQPLFNDMAVHFLLLDNLEFAEEYFLKAKRLKGPEEVTARILYNLGGIYVKTGRNELAVESINQAILIWESKKNNENLLLCYTALIEANQEIDHSLARLYIDTAMTMAKEVQNNQVLNWVILYEGSILLKEGRCQQAKQLISSAYQYFQQYGGPQDIIDDSRTLLLENLQCLGEKDRMIALFHEQNEAAIKQEELQLQRLNKQIIHLMTWKDQLEQAEGSLMQSRERADQLSFIASIIGVFFVITALLTVYILSLIRKSKRINNELAQLNLQNKQLVESLSQSNQDLTKANTQIGQMNKALEQQVEKRTQEVLRKNKTLSDYVHWNAHRLRRPLANIKGLLALLKENRSKSFDLDDQKLLELLAESTNRLDDTVSEFNRDLSDS